MGRVRPTKGMMLAVNAAIDGDMAEVDRLIKEFSLEGSELQERLALRDGRKYTMSTNGRDGAKAPRGSGPRGRAGGAEISIAVNGRTSVRQLFRLIEQADQVKAKAQQELKRRPGKEIDAVKKTLTEIELLRKQREKLEQKIREVEDSLF